MIKFTGAQILDPIVAILVALLILKESYHLLMKAYHPLLDTALEKSELELIIQTLKEQKVAYHNLKTRKSGNYKFIEFHMELPANMTLLESHNRCDVIENLLEQTLSPLTVTIHVEPIEGED